MKPLLTEAIGTFFLVLSVGLGVNHSAALAPIAIGFALMVMVYAGRHISGGHYNPAVSLGAMLRGALPGSKLLTYWAAQFVGAIAAGLLIWKFTGFPLHMAPGDTTTALKAVTGETIATFALVYVVLHTATSKATEGNSYFGLAIGGTVAVMAVVMGPITGGAFNPAVGLGPVITEFILGRAVTPLAWVYAVGPLVGGALAAYAFKFQESGAA